MDEVDIPPPDTAAAQPPPFVLTYELLESIYASLYRVRFAEPVTEYTTPTLRSFSSLRIPFVHLLDLFLHSANPAYSGPYPQFTFPEVTINKLQQGVPIKFSTKDHINSPPTTTISINTAAHQTPTPLQAAGDDAIVPPTFDINHADYLAGFLSTLGDPTAFAAHLRSIYLLCHASRTLLSSMSAHDLNWTCDDVQLMTITLTNLLQHLLVYFSAVCDHYDLAAAGSLDIASTLSAFLRVHSLEGLYVDVDVKLFTIADSPIMCTEDLGDFFNDDELKFITTTLPQAFSNSPLNPKPTTETNNATGTDAGAVSGNTDTMDLNDLRDDEMDEDWGSDEDFAEGIVLPVDFSTPQQAQSFTQHYTHLLPANAPQHAKVPLSDIPFSIFVYVGFIQHMMGECWWVLANLTSGVQHDTFACWNHGLRELLPLYLAAVPTLPSRLLEQILQCVANVIPEGPSAIGSLLDQVPLLQVLEFKLNEIISFPVLADNPQASLRTHTSMSTLGSIVMTVSNLVHLKTNRDIFLQSSLLALRVVRILLLMIFAKQFPTLSQDTQPAHDESHTSHDDQHQQINKTNSNENESTPVPNRANPYFATLMDNDVVLPEGFLKSDVVDCLDIILRIAKNEETHASPEIKTALAALFAPDLFPLIMALVIRLRLDPTPLLSTLGTFVLADDELTTTVMLSNFYLLAEYVATIPRDEHAADIRQITWVMANIAVGAPQQLVYQIVRTTLAPFLNQSLSSQFYYRTMARQDYSLDLQRYDADLMDEVLSQRSPELGFNSPQGPLRNKEDFRPIYRFSSRTVPQGYPQPLRYLPHSIRLQYMPEISDPDNKRHVDVNADRTLDEVYWVFYNIFQGLAPHLLHKQLYYINHRDTFFDTFDTPNPPCQSTGQAIEMAPNLEPTELAPTPPSFSQQMDDELPQHSMIQPAPPTAPTSSLFDHMILPTTKLAVDPMIQLIPYMAIHQNFNRLIFHLLSCLQWNSSLPKTPQRVKTYPASTISWLLLYVELFHTYLCKPIELIQVEDATLTTKPTLQNQYAASKHTPASASDTWDSICFGQVASTSQPTTDLEGCIMTRPQDLQDHVRTYSHPSTFHQHAHLQPYIIRQLYYVYTETLLSCIAGFCFASFQTPLRNDQTAEFVAAKLDQLSGADKEQDNKALLVGISALRDDAETWSFLPESGTLFEATLPFSDGEPVSPDVLEEDSYHRHLIDLHMSPQSVLYAFQPQRHSEPKQRQLQYLSTPGQIDSPTQTGDLKALNTPLFATTSTSHLPNHAIEFQKTGLMPLSLEWSSSCVQHFIELFLDLLLNENAWTIVSQIDFSDDQQPVPKEFVVDYVRRDDPYEWATRQPQFGDEDHYPLFTDYVPSKYQAQIPTLATLAIDPSNPSSLPHSIFNPAVTADEEKTALQQYYNSHPTRCPTLIFNQASEEEEKMGYKVPTRGHLPFFYNLTSSEQDELYAAFDQATLFDDMLREFPAPILPTRLTPHKTDPIIHNHLPPVHQPSDFDVQSCVDFINSALPLEQQQARLKRAKMDEDVEEVNNFDNHKLLLTRLYAPPPSSIPDYQPCNAKLLLEATQALLSKTLPLSPHHLAALQSLFHEPLVDKQQLNDMFQQDNMSPDATPGTLSPSFTVPAETLLNYIKFNRRQTALDLPRAPNPYLTNIDGSIPPKVSEQYHIVSKQHPLTHNLLSHHPTTHLVNFRDQTQRYQDQLHEQLRLSLDKAGLNLPLDQAGVETSAPQTRAIEEWAGSPLVRELLRSAFISNPDVLESDEDEWSMDDDE